MSRCAAGAVERRRQVIAAHEQTFWDRSGMSVDSGSRQGHPLLTANYAAALVVCAVAAFLQYWLQPPAGERFPFVVFPAAIVAAAWSGSLGPGLAATAAAAVVTDYFFLRPVHSFWISDPADGLALALFVLAAAIVTIRTRDLRRRAGLDRLVRIDTARELEHTASLQELTAALLRAEGEREVIHVGLTELLHWFAAAAGAVLLADEREAGYEVAHAIGYADPLRMSPEHCRRPEALSLRPCEARSSSSSNRGRTATPGSRISRPRSVCGARGRSGPAAALGQPGDLACHPQF